MASILEEKDAIHETIANYCYHFDGGEFSQWVDLFTEDGVFDGGEVAGVHTGKEALRAFVAAVPGRMAMQDGAPMLKHCVMKRNHQGRWGAGRPQRAISSWSAPKARVR